MTTAHDRVDRPEQTRRVGHRVALSLLGVRVAAPVHREGGAGPSDDGHVVSEVNVPEELVGHEPDAEFARALGRYRVTNGVLVRKEK